METQPGILDLNEIVKAAVAARENAQRAWELIQAVEDVERDLQEAARTFAHQLGVAETFKRLNELPAVLWAAGSEIAAAETELSALKSCDLREAEEDLELALIEATMEAHASGEIDGSNSETRRVQMSAWLNNSPEVKESREAVAQIERKVAEAEVRVTGANTSYKARAAALNAACRAAELQAALLNTKGVERDG